MFRRNHALNVGGCISGYQTQYNTYTSVRLYPPTHPPTFS